MLRPKKSNTLILIHTGSRWYGGVRKNNTWEKRTESAPFDQFPEGILNWAESLGIRNVRAATRSDIVDLGVSDQELAAMSALDAVSFLNGELSEKAGIDAMETCPAAAALPVETPEGRRMQLAAAPFEKSLIEQFATDCRLHGMALEGVAPFHGIFLARTQPRNVTFFAGERGVFICGTSSGTRHFHWQSLAYGHTDATRTQENAKRLLRLLDSFQYDAIHLVAASEQIQDIRFWISAALPGVQLIDAPLEMLIPEAFETLESTAVDPGESLIGFATRPPEAQDSRKIGGKLCVAIILLTATLLGLQFFYLNRQKQYYTDLQMQISLVEAERTSAANAFENAQKEIQRVRALCATLENPPPRVSGQYLEVMAALSQAATAYSHVTSIRQETGQIRIGGITLWQGDLSTFYDNLQQELSAHRLRIIPQEVKDIADSDERSFALLVARQN